jgi:hypothetical protein
MKPENKRVAFYIDNWRGNVAIFAPEPNEPDLPRRPFREYSCFSQAYEVLKCLTRPEPRT